MAGLRSLSPVAPAVLAVVFVLGGLVAPNLHRASHAAEWAAERTAHLDRHHAGHTGDAADVPCPPAVADLDCALCAGVSVATAGAQAAAPRPASPAACAPAPPHASGRDLAVAARPRAPPVG